MKNRDVLLYAIGDVDEKLIPEIPTKKKKSVIIKWAAVASVSVAAIVLVCAMILRPNDKIKTSGTDSSGLTPSATDTDYKDSYMLLASPVYPQLPSYPSEDGYEEYKQWSDAVHELHDQPDGYRDGFDDFFLNSSKVFLTGAENENVIYSPLSLYMALAMSAEITGGNSQSQILDVLSQESIEELRQNAKSMWLANYMDDGMAKCILANSLWTNEFSSYNHETLDAVAENYYSSVFSGDPATDEYNKLFQDWLNNQTDGLLSDYVSGIEMDPEMILAIASTVNYSGKWEHKFSENNTTEKIFHSVDGDVTCEFMRSGSLGSYYWGDKFGSISLPLENNGEMRIILPDEGISPQELIYDEQALSFMLDRRSYENSKYVQINLALPKFDVSSDIDLRDGLRELGITDIFDSSKADFSRLTDIGNVALTEAKQDARVMIDEEGCKAVAMTVLILDRSAMPEDKVDFTVDRPFIFEIVSETGSPLFIGIVNNPTA